MTDVCFLAPAEEEMKASAQYYEQQLSGLGNRFLDEVDRSVFAIQQLPEASPCHSSQHSTQTDQALSLCFALPHHTN